MTVTKIEDIQSKKSAVYIDGEFAFVLYKGELAKYGISQGEEIPRDKYELLTGEVLVKRARLRAMNLLKSRPYTEKGLRDKLVESRYPGWLCDNAIDYVKSFGYVDDEAYARDYAASLAGRTSERMIRQKLLQKGVSKEVADRCLAGLKEENGGREEEVLIKLIDKRCKGVLPSDDKGKASLMRYLAGKGFTTESILKAVKAYQTDT